MRLLLFALVWCAATAFELTVPVAFHVVYERNANGDSVGKASRETLVEQIAQLNKAFSGSESVSKGVDSGFRFVLKSIDYTENERWFRRCPLVAEETEMKTFLNVDPLTTLNVYTCMASFAFGFAHFPAQFPEDSVRHGVVLWFKTLPGKQHNWFTQGDMLVHEVGHFFGLKHPYQGGCLGDEGFSDGILDTPRMSGPVKGFCKNVGRRIKDSCPNSPGNDDLSNYMVATADECRDHFTLGQVLKMQHDVEEFKPALFANSKTLTRSPSSAPPLCVTNGLGGFEPKGVECVLPFVHRRFRRSRSIIRRGLSQTQRSKPYAWKKFKNQRWCATVHVYKNFSQRVRLNWGTVDEDADC